MTDPHERWGDLEDSCFGGVLQHAQQLSTLSSSALDTTIPHNPHNVSHSAATASFIHPHRLNGRALHGYLYCENQGDLRRSIRRIPGGILDCIIQDEHVQQPGGPISGRILDIRRVSTLVACPSRQTKRLRKCTICCMNSIPKVCAFKIRMFVCLWHLRMTGKHS